MKLKKSTNKLCSVCGKKIIGSYWELMPELMVYVLYCLDCGNREMASKNMKESSLQKDKVV